MNKLKVLDLFSGIGGFSLGLEATGGFETVAFCEIDKHCHKVLNKHWKEVPIYNDVKELTGLYGIDVVCGGFPCQDISVAGFKKGITDETRSGLWYEYKRIIKEIKPRFVIIENVRNLLNNGLAIVLQDLHEIGYDAEWEVISARTVGAPHLRERLWIVAYPNRSRLQRQFQEHRKDDGMGAQKNSGCSDSLLCSEPRSISNANDFRFWPTFTTEEEKQQWWTKATSSFCDRWKIESSICRVADGLPKGLDKGRAQRIKQLGNSIVPHIATIIGNQILSKYKGQE